MHFSSFRTKLLVSMMVVVAGVTAATLVLVQSRFATAYQSLLEKQFRREVELFSKSQEIRLKNTRKKCDQLAGSVRILAALEEGDTDDVYSVALNELQVRELEQTQDMSDSGDLFRFLRFISADGSVLRTWNPQAGMTAPEESRSLEEQLTRLIKTAGPRRDQQVAYIAPIDEAGRTQLEEVVVTRMIDREANREIGAMVLGFPVTLEANSGLWFNEQLFAPELPADWHKLLSEELKVSCEISPAGGSFEILLGGVPHRVFHGPVVSEGQSLGVDRVIIYSVAEALEDERSIQSRIVLLGCLSLLVALFLSWAIARGLSGPIKDLVVGTTAIQRGNFDVRVQAKGRDELGLLASSFNEMASELALKEKYRSVLNMVADKEVARELVEGKVSLGGEVRDISVLFCDIRGFTGLSEKKDATEVVKLLNEHMTALTQIVHSRSGVVDKFVGDLIMAIFGAPKSSGDDAFQAAACALEMIEARERMNASSADKVEIGIGVASGAVVAGCMGSTDRLNYTVIGERVNLASRLCAKAGKGEVLIDRVTMNRLGSRGKAQSLGVLELKGISTATEAFKLEELRKP